MAERRALFLRGPILVAAVAVLWALPSGHCARASGAAGQLKPLAAELRAIGAAQDRALATCREGLRQIRQRCRTAARSQPPVSEFASELRQLTERASVRK